MPGIVMAYVWTRCGSIFITNMEQPRTSKLIQKNFAWKVDIYAYLRRDDTSHNKVCLYRTTVQ